MKKTSIADFLPTLTIKAKDFSAELTSHNVIEKNLKGDTAISKEHIANKTAVRKMLKQRGVQPERLPAAKDVKKPNVGRNAFLVSLNQNLCRNV